MFRPADVYIIKASPGSVGLRAAFALPVCTLWERLGFVNMFGIWRNVALEDVGAMLGPFRAPAEDAAIRLSIPTRWVCS
jgi:hypothetical protein